MLHQTNSPISIKFANYYVKKILVTGYCIVLNHYIAVKMIVYIQSAFEMLPCNAQYPSNGQSTLHCSQGFRVPFPLKFPGMAGMHALESSTT